MIILGVACGHRDSAAALLIDGSVVAAVEEERLTRLKHQGRFPLRSVEEVLRLGNIDVADVDRIAIDGCHSDDEMPPFLDDFVDRCDYVDHCLAHAATAFYPSGFQDAVVLVLDDDESPFGTSIYKTKDGRLNRKPLFTTPLSIGHYATLMTHYLGFEPHEGEYKIMGLAPYGKPVLTDKLRHWVNGSDASSTFLIEQFGCPREAEAALTQRDYDLAASFQSVMTDQILSLAHKAKILSAQSFLCLGGPVAHNIVANAQLRRSGLFENLYIHFGSGNQGTALGAALACAVDHGCQIHKEASPYLGPSYSDYEIQDALQLSSLCARRIETQELLMETARLLDEKAIVGWFQGRMEFGPRALGNRSILASPAHPGIKDILNANVKHRELFRPFAPVICEEQASLYFDDGRPSPSMLFTTQVRKEQRSLIPSVTHIDGSARPQTVTRRQNSLLYDLLKAFEARTGLPVLLNTSFNVRGEPIVCSPRDAISCFMNTQMDALVIGSFIVKKND